MNEDNVFHVPVGNRTITYTLIRSGRRTMSVEISPDCRIIVRAPYRLSNRRIESFLQEKAAWIFKALEKAAKRQEQTDALSKDALPPEKAALLESFYRNKAREVLTDRVRYYQPFIGKPVRSISIRDQKTRWGSCSSKGGLNFNWRLILAPPAVLDYVVVHELCHLLHMDHSPAFWAEVAKLCPNYKECRKWLRDNGSTLRIV